MRSRLVVIAKIRRKHAAQVALVENDDVVETLAAYGAYDALHIGVPCPRRYGGGDKISRLSQRFGVLSRDSHFFVYLDASPNLWFDLANASIQSMLIGEASVRVDRAELRNKRTAAPNKATVRKPTKRKTDFKTSNWYQSAALSVAIPEDRRDRRN